MVVLASVELAFAPLDAASQEARLRTTSWQGLFESGILSPDEMTVMNELCERENWAQLLLKEGSIYFTVPLGILQSGRINKPPVQMGVLTLLYDLLVHHPERLQSMIKEASPPSLKSLSHLLLANDEVLAGQAARVLAIIALLNQGLPAEDAKAFLGWIESSIMLFPEKEQRVLLATLLLEHLLRVSSLRSTFAQREEVIRVVVESLARCRNVQIQYQAIFAIWLLCYDSSIAAQLQTRFGIITLLLDVAKAAMKEKIIRLCVGIWKNLLVHCHNIAVPVMIGAKVLDFLETLASRKLSDEEMVIDVSYIKEELNRAYSSLNSFDEYASEIKSHKLEWSPPHKSELFWEENASRLQENDCELLRILTKLLTPGNDPKVMAIAAHDIGQYVLHCPNGRQTIEEQSTKQQIMLLISHEDPEVRYQALTAVQKYMSKLWSPA